MGVTRRPQPRRLPAKLKQIRLALGLSQEKMLVRLNYTKSPLVAAQISRFETGDREPPLEVLLAYTRAAGIAMEWLVDDELDLPKKFLK